MARIAMFAILALAAVAAVSAHSWLDCADWRFNDPSALTNPSIRRWGDSDGKCYAHARRFEVTAKPFGKMDEVQFFRHYVQPFKGGSELACRVNAGGYNAEGSNEGTPSPRSAGYAPAKNVYNQVYGTMAQVYAGQTLCWRWPAKNHFAHVDVSTNPLFINWDDVAGRTEMLTQTQMDTKRVASVLWANCPVPGPASNGDSSGVGSELRPCGNCFTVPQRSPGIYTVQWVWPFKNANSETYTSCADIEVLQTATTTTPTTGGGTTTTPVVTNCAVSAWGDWGVCSSNCGSGTQKRTRTITTQPTVSGTQCPTLTDAQACNTQSCATNSDLGTGISAHVVYESQLVDFTDWSWAAKSRYSLTQTDVARSGRAIRWQPNNWEALYFNYDIGQVNVKDYQSIYFWINGGQSSGQQITFSLVTTSRVSSPLFTYPIPAAKIKAGQWQRVDIVFSNLKLVNGNFDGFWFQANSGRLQSTVYIDDIYFMHVHAGGPQASITSDPCDGVSCTGNSACLGGQCYCTNGFYGEGCSTAGGIQEVTVKSLTGQNVTSIDAGATYLVSWEATGTLPVLSVMLFKDGSNIPEHLATQVANQGYYTWMVPNTLAAGTYTVRVAYTRSVYGESEPMSKTSAAVSNGCGSCSGHGTCDEDTAPNCVCRYQYSGATCSQAPDGIVKTPAVIMVGAPIALYNEDAPKFTSVLRADLSAALFVEPDQIEVKSVTEHSSSMSRVEFDLVSGGGYLNSTLAISSESTYNQRLAQQLATADSNINRATYTYASESSVNAASSVRAPSALVSLAMVAASVVAMATAAVNVL